MEYTLNHKTREYEVYITIPSPGIKGPQNKLIGSFKTEIEAKAAVISAKKTQEIMQSIPRVPTNEEINRWIASKMSYPGL